MPSSNKQILIFKNVEFYSFLLHSPYLLGISGLRRDIRVKVHYLRKNLAAQRRGYLPFRVRPNLAYRTKR